MYLRRSKKKNTQKYIKAEYSWTVKIWNIRIRGPSRTSLRANWPSRTPSSTCASSQGTHGVRWQSSSSASRQSRGEQCAGVLRGVPSSRRSASTGREAGRGKRAPWGEEEEGEGGSAEREWRLGEGSPRAPWERSGQEGVGTGEERDRTGERELSRTCEGLGSSWRSLAFGTRDCRIPYLFLLPPEMRWNVFSISQFVVPYLSNKLLLQYYKTTPSSPIIGPLISRWELDKFKNCWNKSFRTSKILKLLYQQFSNLSISQRDMSGPRLGSLSNNRWSGGTLWVYTTA